MGDEVLAYESPNCQNGAGWRIAKMVAVLSLAAIVTLAQALPTSFGHGGGPGCLVSETTYGWLGTFLRVTHRFYLAAPMTTSYDIFWRPLAGNVGIFGLMWAACIIYCRRIKRP